MLGLTSSVAKLLILATTGGLGLPFGVPPTPEDSALAGALPEECLLAAGWAGTASPDPKSPNQTEQLLAEPEVQNFLTQIDIFARYALQGGLKAGAKDDPTAPLPGNALRSIITHPGVVFLSNIKSSGKPDTTEIEGGLVLSLGADAALVEASMKLSGPSLWNVVESFVSPSVNSDNRKSKTPPPSDEIVKIDGQDWHRVAKATIPGQRIVYGFRNNCLIVGVGEKGLENILARMKKGNPPAWWSAIGKQLPIERRSVVLYANVRRLTDLFLSIQEPEQQARTRARFEFLGLSNATAWIEVWGLEGDCFANKTLLTLDGEPSGLLQLVSAQPLKSENLAPIPRDSTVAVALRLDLEKALDVVLASYEKMDPKTKAEMTQTIDQWERSFGVDLRHGTLKSVGDTWCLYGSPNEGNLFFTGLTAVVPLRDWAGMSLSYGRLMGAAKQWSPNRKERPDGTARTSRVEQFTFAGNDVYWLNATDDMPFFFWSPFNPSWCMTKQELVVSLWPQNVKAYLSHDSRHEPIHRLPEIAKLFSNGNGPVMVAYGDSLYAFKLFYPLFCTQAQTFMNVASPQHPEANASLLPSGLAINRHLGPTVATLRRTKHGIEFVSRGTIPLPSAPLYAAFTTAIDTWSPFCVIPPAAAQPPAEKTAAPRPMPANSDQKARPPHVVPADKTVPPAEMKPAASPTVNKYPPIADPK